MVSQTNKMTGYPSIDKPWLKYYKNILTEQDVPTYSAFRMIYENNKDFLSETAIWFFDRKIQYVELFDKIRKAASAFNKLGIQKGDVVTLQLLNTPQTVIIFYALSYIGAVANMIYITSSEQEVKELLLNTESKMYITFDSVWNKTKFVVKSIGINNVLLLGIGEEADWLTKSVLSVKRKRMPDGCISWKQFLKIGIDPVQEINNPNLPVAMVYTSGTTGKSKAVMLSNKSLTR